ncbi:M1 family metallopeptidase [Pareuzebyella sediminis]|uniref:M1 family metallopeptidase n=1 Tax=Pareuzebyella sediminis TaxID=2607998 RepID=UPI0011EE3B11|nr:M1 family metallopeptidase [Pareuzebyella sediminis]
MKYGLPFIANFLILFSVFGNPITDNYPKNPNIDALNYTFRIALSDSTDEIYCEETVDIQFLAAGIHTLRLDLVKATEKLENKGMIVSGVTSKGKVLSFTHENDALIIRLPSPSITNQRTSYTIIYQGIPATGLHIGNNKYGDRTFFSDNWPNKGRNWMATIDHPYDKATCEFIVTAPERYQVVSNGLKIEETNLPQGRRLTHWKQSVPIATWLYVLGVAEFAVQYVDEFEGKSIQTWVYPQDREAGFYDFAQPTKAVLEFFNDRIGPFSYEKLANVQSNSVSGAMEAATAILYDDEAVVGDRNERWRNVAIHEIAHHWFGNAVTEYDWDDVWLSEGFATYFTLLFIEHQYGRDAFLEGLAKSKKTVDEFYLEHPDYRIVHDNLADLSKVVSVQTYQKGSWALHMLRGVMGTAAFWHGIQTYYQRYQNANATTDDFRREMEAASGLDLRHFFEQWLYRPGILKLEGTWNYNTKKKEISIKLKQVQKDGSVFNMPLEIGVYGTQADQKMIQKVRLENDRETYKFLVEFAPEKVMLDPNTWILMDSNLKEE